MKKIILSLILGCASLAWASNSDSLLTRVSGSATNSALLNSSAYNPASLSFVVDPNEKLRVSFFPAEFSLGIQVNGAKGVDGMAQSVQDLLASTSDTSNTSNKSLVTVIKDVQKIVEDSSPALTPEKKSRQLNAELHKLARLPSMKGLDANDIKTRVKKLSVTYKNEDNTDKLEKEVNNQKEDLIKSQINSLLGELKTVSLALQARVAPLLLPLVFRSDKLKGNVSLDFNGTLYSKISFVDGGDVTFEKNENNEIKDIKTDSGITAKSVIAGKIGVTYSSNRLLKNFTEVFGRWGRIDLGTRLNFYPYASSYIYANLSQKGVEDVKDQIKDTVSGENQDLVHKGLAVGLDFGVLHTLKYFQWGLTWYNINSPSIEYPDLTKIGSSENRRHVKALGKRAMLDSSVNLNSQFVLEGSGYFVNKAVLLQGSYAINKTNDMLGNQVQNLNLSTTLSPRFRRGILNFLIPTLRLGLTKNLVGNERKTYNVGLTLFSSINLDVWTSSWKEIGDIVSGDGTPNYADAGFSLYITESF